MKRFFLALFVTLCFTGGMAAQNLAPVVGLHPSSWWDNAFAQPWYQSVWDDTLETGGETSSWYELTKYGHDIFRLSFALDTISMIGAGQTAADSTGFYFSWEVKIDSASSTTFTNLDGTSAEIAAADSASAALPYNYIHPLDIYEGRWIRFTFYTTRQCSLTADLGGHR